MAWCSWAGTNCPNKNSETGEWRNFAGLMDAPVYHAHDSWPTHRSFVEQGSAILHVELPQIRSS
jgi:hypothetical protein